MGPDLEKTMRFIRLAARANRLAKAVRSETLTLSRMDRVRIALEVALKRFEEEADGEDIPDKPDA